MKKPPRRDWATLSLFALGVVTAFASGAYIAQRFVSPCVCVFMEKAGVMN